MLYDPIRVHRRCIYSMVISSPFRMIPGCWRRQSSRKRTHFITMWIWLYARSRAIYQCIGQTYLKISKSFLAIWTHERRSIRIISFFWFNFFLHFMQLILWTVHFWSILGEKLVRKGRVWVWLGLSHIY